MAVLLAALAASAPAVAGQGGVTISWYTQAVIKLTLTPNYYTGYGTVKAVFGTQPAASPGPGACLQGCAVDFGNVVSGTDYLYKYATHLNVDSNDANGFSVYGEGAADFYNTADSSSQPVDQALFYLPSGATSDSNTGFTAALPFYRTSGSVSGGGSFNTAPSIAYGTYPSPMVTKTTAQGDLYYDYQLKVPPAATGGQYYVWVVYTVVAQ